MKKKFGICKYDINGKHYLLDDEGKLYVFNSEKDAVMFMFEKGLSKEEVNELSIEKLTKEELKDAYKKEKV